MLGIQHDTRQHGVGFFPQKIRRLNEILQQLRHQFRGGGGIGLMEAESSVFNVACSPAVVVDDRHTVAGFQDLGAFHHFRAVGIYHHQQRAGTHAQKGVRGIGEHTRVLRRGFQPPQHLMGGVFLAVNNDLGFLAPLAGGAGNTCGGADGVHIRIAVTHDIDLRGVIHQLPQGIGHHAGLHLRPLLRSLGAAAVELEIHLIAHDRLIAAAAEGHFQRELRVLIQLRQCLGILTHADGKGRMEALAHFNAPHSIQNRKFPIHELLIVLLFKNIEVAVPLGLDQKARPGGCPAVDLFVDLGLNGAALGIGADLGHFVVVIHHQNGHHRAGGVVSLPDIVGLGGIHPVGGGHHIAAPAPGADHRPVDPVAAVVQLHPLGTFLPPLQQPRYGKLRYGVLQLHLKKMLPDSCQLQKGLVGPDDLSGVRPKNHGGQGGIHQRGFAGAVHTAGNGVDVLQNVLLALIIDAAGIEKYHRRHSSLQKAQRSVH